MKTILLVDDDRVRSATFVSALVHEGYAVDATTSCRQALTKLAGLPAGEPCVVLLRGGSEITGQELLAELHANGRATTYPVVVLPRDDEAPSMDRLLAIVHDVCHPPIAPS